MRCSQVPEVETGILSWAGLPLVSQPFNLFFNNCDFPCVIVQMGIGGGKDYIGLGH